MFRPRDHYSKLSKGRDVMTKVLRIHAEEAPQAGLVAGIDTHKDTHHVAVIDEFGRPVIDQEFSASAAGYGKVVDLFTHLGHVVKVGVEGTGSYGAGIARVLTREGFKVIEVMRTNRQARRRRGKSDPLDAHQAAMAVLSGAEDTTPKSGDGPVEAMRILLAERRSTIKAKTQIMNQVHSLLITTHDEIRVRYRHLTGMNLIKTLARTRPGTTMIPSPKHIAKQSLKRLAQRYVVLDEQVQLIDAQLHELVQQANPRLLQIFGVGPLGAATLLVAAGDNPQRLRSKAAFAAMVGVAPIPASSGQRTRHRLSRGGNRRANAAIHQIVMLRMRHKDPRTMTYFERRRAENLTDRDIIRCLKRYIANEVYAALMNPTLAEHPGPALRTQRRAVGIPMTELAEMVGVSYQSLQRFEVGTRYDPELEERIRQQLATINTKSAA